MMDMASTVGTADDSARRAARRDSGRRAARRRSASGWIFAVVLVLVSIALFVFLETAVRFETQLAQWAISAALDTGTRVTGDGTSLLVGIGGTRAFTLRVGIACSVVLILVPFLLVAAAMLASGRASAMRALPAVVIGAAALVAVNMARLVLIAFVTMKDGLDGFGWAHTVYGSAVALIGLTLVTAAFIGVMAIGRRRSREKTPS